MADGNRFLKLVELARETGSDRRRELLREVTDLFFETSGARGAREDMLIGEVLQRVAHDMQDGVLAELSARFAHAPDAPLGLMQDLANHAFQVAEPVLRHSPVLADGDLVGVVQNRSQDHIKAIAQRSKVSEFVSAAIVKNGDDVAVDALMRNDGAKLSRDSMEIVVDRARKNSMLHEGVVRRHDMPIDLLNEMYFLVENRLRDQILERNAGVDAAALEEALAKTRDRMRGAAKAQTEDFRRAEAFIRQQKKAGELSGRLLIAAYREKKTAEFLCGLAELTGVDVGTAQDVVERRDIDAIAMLCRAAEMERPIFVTLAIMMSGEESVSKGEEFGRMYAAVPVEAAQRAMRFYRVRKATQDQAAA